MKRINFIDISRGFAMFFIVLGHAFVHSLHCSIAFKLLYSFHVVLFFILSGYTFKIKQEKSLFFIKNKFIHIMLPYFIWSILFLLPYYMFGRNIGENFGNTGSYDILNNLVNILYGVGANSALKQNTPLWFLPTLFVIEIFYYFIIRISNKSIEKALIVLLPIIGLLSCKFLNIALPWGISSFVNIGFFFYYGYLIKKYNILNCLFKFKYMIIFSICGITCALINKSVSCVDYDYGNVFLFYISSFTLSIVVLYLSNLVDKNKLLEYIGRNTMGILIFHKLILVVFQSKIPIISSLLRDSNFIIEFLIAIVISVMSIALSILATIVMRNICPQLIGEKCSDSRNNNINNNILD